MVMSMTKCFASIQPFRDHVLHFSSTPSFSSAHLLRESIRAAVETKAYQQIPELLNSSKESHQNPNPFTFLSTFPENLRTQIIDEILQNLIDLRPRYRPQAAYSCLLSYTLQGPNPLPLALAILQRTLRSGCVPVPQTHLLLSNAWLDRRHRSHPVCGILSEMQSIGYRADCGTCNYLISSLCKVDQLTEAVQVLKGMGGAGCIPDLDSYGYVIGPMGKLRRTASIVELMKDMVGRLGLTPRQETVVKVLGAIRSKKDMWRGVEMVDFLQSHGVYVGFECYDLVVKGCLECGEFVLAGKVVIEMTKRGFIPYIKARQKVVEGLASAGQWDLAYSLRQRFAELKS